MMLPMNKPNVEMVERRITELIADNVTDGSSLPEMVDGGELLRLIRGYAPGEYDRIADALYGPGNGKRNAPAAERPEGMKAVGDFPQVRPELRRNSESDLNRAIDLMNRQD